MYLSTLPLTGENILAFLLRHLGREYSIREVANSVNQDYKIVFTTARRLVKEGLVNINRISNINRCSARLSKNNAIIFAHIREREAQTMLPKKVINAIRETIQSITNPFYALLVFGSYAKGNVRPTSDVDLIAIVAERSQEPEMLAAIKKSATLNNLRINPVILTAKEFQAGLKEPSVAKEVYENHQVIYGGEAFYSLVSQ